MTMNENVKPGQENAAKAGRQPDISQPVAQPKAMFLLSQANQAVRGRLEAALAAFQITAIQYTVMSAIDDRDGFSSAELARLFHVTPQSMNELTGGLQRRDLIRRREDPANRRILRMSLTAEGRRIIDNCNVVADQVERQVFSCLSREDYDRFHHLCRRIARSLREDDEAAGSE